MILKDVENKLNVRPETLERALNKALSVIHTVGNDVALESEIKRLIRRYSSYNNISDELFDFLVRQKNSVSDYVSISDIQKEYCFNKHFLSEFVSLKKFKSKNGIVDYLGSNVFLNSNQKYVQKRKTKSFIRSFVLWLLSNHSFVKANLEDVEFGFKSEFNTLEEVYFDNSKKGRILGFSKFDDGKIKAIVALYSGEFIFSHKLKRTIDYVEFDDLDDDDRPIVFNLPIKVLINRDYRQLFNIMVIGLSNNGVRFTWSGTRILLETNLTVINLNCYDEVGLSKAKIKQLNNNFGKVDEHKISEFFNKYLLKSAYCYSKQKRIFFNSKLKKLNFWVAPDIARKFEKIGISANLSPSVVFEQLISTYSLLNSDDETEFLNKLNEIYLNWSNDINNAFIEWQRVLNTNNTDETIDKISGILQGRIKWNN